MSDATELAAMRNFFRALNRLSPAQVAIICDLPEGGLAPRERNDQVVCRVLANCQRPILRADGRTGRFGLTEHGLLVQDALLAARMDVRAAKGGEG